MVRRLVPLSLLIALLVAAAPAAAQGPGPPDSARMVSARMWQRGKITAKHETPDSIGAALASLRPTFVSALLRYDKTEPVTDRQIASWNTVVAAVHETSPAAQFDVELNGLQYRSAGQVLQRMQAIRSKVGPDGWLIDFYTNAVSDRPKVWQAAIESAHDNGEFLGGNAFGIAGHPPVPNGTDYEAVQDSNMKVNLPATRALAKRVTTFMHLGNDPDLPSSDGCTFIEKFSTRQRIAYVRQRAGQQEKYDFRFQYPVFFPECARNRQLQTPPVFAYNATRDAPMMPAIGSLLDRYEPAAPAFSLLP